MGTVIAANTGITKVCIDNSYAYYTSKVDSLGNKLEELSGNVSTDRSAFLELINIANRNINEIRDVLTDNNSRFELIETDMKVLHASIDDMNNHLESIDKNEQKILKYLLNLASITAVLEIMNIIISVYCFFDQIKYSVKSYSKIKMRWIFYIKETVCFLLI